MPLRIAGAIFATAGVVAFVAARDASSARGFATPIEHVVVILQENHSFDNVLGQLCIQEKRACDAASVGKLENGSTLALSKASDFVIQVRHDQLHQLEAIDGGKMDGFEDIPGCTSDQCYTQYYPEQIPNLAALAKEGTISDRFFSRDIVPSWGGHMDFFAQTLDGFVGDNPIKRSGDPAGGAGWGCDGNKEAQWTNPETHKLEWQPSCVPNQKGEGAFRSTPVAYTPTFGDRLDAAGRTWGIYGGVNPKASKEQINYGWAICPTFAECLDGPQKNNMHEDPAFFTAAKEGTLPNFAILIPNGASGETSQHNGDSMMVGDRHIGEEVAAIEAGPDAKSTTIFIYYDDCGCFYDHVTPPAGLGIRLPLVIVSHYDKRGFTDHNVATNSSILAYAEQVLGVSPVNSLDATAYNFSESFNYAEPHVSAFQFRAGFVPLADRNLHPAPDGT